MLLLHPTLSSPSEKLYKLELVFPFFFFFYLSFHQALFLCFIWADTTFSFLFLPEFSPILFINVTWATFIVLLSELYSAALLWNPLKTFLSAVWTYFSYVLESSWLLCPSRIQIWDSPYTVSCSSFQLNSAVPLLILFVPLVLLVVLNLLSLSQTLFLKFPLWTWWSILDSLHMASQLPLSRC